MNCLIMPPQSTGLDLECDNRREVQIVTSPVVAAILRHAVSRPEVHKPEIEVCRSDEPDRAAACPPGIVIPRPCLVAGFAGSRNRKPLPDLSSRHRVERDGFS